jgi:hypothetical protein
MTVIPYRREPSSEERLAQLAIKICQGVATSTAAANDVGRSLASAPSPSGRPPPDPAKIR